MNSGDHQLGTKSSDVSFLKTMPFFLILTFHMMKKEHNLIRGWMARNPPELASYDHPGAVLETEFVTPSRKKRKGAAPTTRRC